MHVLFSLYFYLDHWDEKTDNFLRTILLKDAFKFFFFMNDSSQISFFFEINSNMHG